MNLDTLSRRGEIAEIVRHFALAVGGKDEDAMLAAALACHAMQSGHVCADLHGMAGWGPWAALPCWRDDAKRAEFLQQLPKLAPVGAPEDWKPLIWDGTRLYLQRYWRYETRLADDLRRRASVMAIPIMIADDLLTSPHPQPLYPQGHTSPEGRGELCESPCEFHRTGEDPSEAQRLAAQHALHGGLTLISGAPGTGKTTTLARILVLLTEQMAACGHAPRIGLAAPTGKAAARMQDAIRQTWQRLGLPTALPEEAVTLHRLLGIRPDEMRARHDRKNQLPLDVLVVDEASMVDLALMARLLDALPNDARLILLGDRDQLASVEAGAVFADLCDAPALASCVVKLETSFRFGADSGIGRLAKLLRDGDAAGAIALLQASACDDLKWHEEQEQAALVAVAAKAYRPYLEAARQGAGVAELFTMFQKFRILCAHRNGSFGVVGLNAAIEAALAAHGLIQAQPGESSYAGRPLMITANDYTLRLFNGDIGIVLPDPAADGALRAFFPSERAGQPARSLPLARLPAHETVFAMTVHKSQGSEFGRVLLALPETDSPVATRELVYTGITRARQQVSLWAQASALTKACERKTQRMSGLRQRLG